MSAKKPALGRGLDALFSPPSAAATEEAGLREVGIEEIEPNPYQPRQEFDPEKLEELAASIRQQGLLQPIMLRPSGDHFQIVAGERRWRASQRAGLRRVPAVIREFTDQAMVEAALIENIQRDNLNPIEEAQGYERLTREFGLTQEALAEAVGKSRAAVANALRLLRLPPPVLQWVREGRLSAGHARALLALDTPPKQEAAAREIVEKDLSVRATEALVRRRGEAKPSRKHKSGGEVRDDVAEMQDRLTERLGLKVRIHPTGNASGRVEIHYASLDEFQGLTERLGVNSA